MGRQPVSRRDEVGEDRLSSGPSLTQQSAHPCLPLLIPKGESSEVPNCYGLDLRCNVPKGHVFKGLAPSLWFFGEVVDPLRGGANGKEVKSLLEVGEYPGKEI